MMRRGLETFVIGTLCGLLFQSCAVGPDYSRPDVKVPADYANASARAERRDFSEWWNSFEDPELTSLIERARKSSPDVRTAAARLEQARAARGVASGEFLPDLSATASFKRSHSPPAGVSNPTGAQLRAAVNQYHAGLDLSWEIDLFGGQRRNLEAADADLLAAIEDSRAVDVTIAAEVGTAYANLRSFQRQLALARSNLEAQKHTAEITHKRHEAGYVNGLDAANADSQVSATESQIPSLESSVAATVYSLSLLLGEEPAALSEELSKVDQDRLTLKSPEVPLGLPSELLERRPDIRRAEAQAQAATARVGVAKADLFPKFTLTGTYGDTSSQRRLIGEPVSRVWSFGPSLTLPLFQIYRIRWAVKEQEALQEASLIAYEKTVLTALSEVETALVACAAERARRATLTRGVESSTKAVDIANRLYLAGKTDFLNLATAQRNLFSAQDSLAQSERNLAVNTISLYKALGGGWKDDAK